MGNPLPFEGQEKSRELALLLLMLFDLFDFTPAFRCEMQIALDGEVTRSSY